MPSWTSSTATITQLAAHYSAIVARAESGEPVIITRNGKPVAKIVPLDPEDGEGCAE